MGKSSGTWHPPFLIGRTASSFALKVKCIDLVGTVSLALKAGWLPCPSVVFVAFLLVWLRILYSLLFCALLLFNKSWAAGVSLVVISQKKSWPYTKKSMWILKAYTYTFSNFLKKKRKVIDEKVKNDKQGVFLLKKNWPWRTVFLQKSP
jgi:hypothetical protein